MSSVVVDALKKKALDAARASALRESVYFTVATSAATDSPPTATDTPTAWPSVLKNDGVLFSKLFGDLMGSAKYKDFHVPVHTDYKYPEWMRAYIPKGSDYQSDPTLLYDAVLAYACGSVTHLVGWPGTGKTNGLPVLIASRVGLPLLRLGLNKKGMMLEDLVGREAILNGDDGMTTGHRDGMLIPWIQHPAIILADEFCRTNVEISNGLMSLMERNGCLIVENRDTPIINRHQHCWILASDNVKGLGDRASSMVGTDVMDGAILDRFEVTLEVDYLDAKSQQRLVEAWFPGFPAAECWRIVQFGGLIQEAYKKDLLPVSFSPRTLREVARYASIHEDVAPAVRKFVLSKYAEDGDVQAIREMYRTVFGASL